MSHGSKVVPRIAWWTEKGPFCWSYHRVAISPVITFMVRDTSEHCKDVQVVTKILADTKNEWMEVCGKAPEEITEQRLKQWYTLTSKDIVNSNKTGKGSVYTLPKGQHSAKAQHRWLATGRPMLWQRSHRPAGTFLLPLVPKGGEAAAEKTPKMGKWK